MDGRIKRLNSQDSISVGQVWDYDYDGFSPQRSTPAHSLPYAARLNRRGASLGPPEIMRMLQGEVSLKSSVLPDFVFPCLEVGVRITIISVSLSPRLIPCSFTNVSLFSSLGNLAMLNAILADEVST